MTEFSDKCGLLGELWINYKDDKDLGGFKDFIDYNDIGLPLAYMIAEGLVNEATPMGEEYVNESFKMLLAGVSVDESEIEPGWTLIEFLQYISDREQK